MWKQYNANPTGKIVGDCVVRAISTALDKSWDEVYAGISLDGYLLGDMPNANHVWGAYLRRNGYRREIVPDSCPDCYTVADFAADHPHGTYILALPQHVVCVRDGDWIDTWDSGDEIPIYYWKTED